MKVVFASTPDQEEKIKELIGYFYSDIFPLYFSDEEIGVFQRDNVLHTSKRHFENFDTLKEAYQVITSLHTLISLLENKERDLDQNYQAMYYNNVRILKKYGLYFPFAYDHFSTFKYGSSSVLSIYGKAENALLV